MVVVACRGRRVLPRGEEEEEEHASLPVDEQDAWHTLAVSSLVGRPSEGEEEKQEFSRMDDLWLVWRWCFFPLRLTRRKWRKPFPFSSRPPQRAPPPLDGLPFRLDRRCGAAAGGGRGECFFRRCRARLSCRIGSGTGAPMEGESEDPCRGR